MKNKWMKLDINQRKIIKIILVFQLFLFLLGLVLSILVYEGVL